MPSVQVAVPIPATPPLSIIFDAQPKITQPPHSASILVSNAAAPAKKQAHPPAQRQSAPPQFQIPKTQVEDEKEYNFDEDDDTQKSTRLSDVGSVLGRKSIDRVAPNKEKAEKAQKKFSQPNASGGRTVLLDSIRRRRKSYSQPSSEEAKEKSQPPVSNPESATPSTLVLDAPPPSQPNRTSLLDAIRNKEWSLKTKPIEQRKSSSIPSSALKDVLRRRSAIENSDDESGSESDGDLD